jgi:hypothetical protein
MLDTTTLHALVQVNTLILLIKSTLVAPLTTTVPVGIIVLMRQFAAVAKNLALMTAVKTEIALL